MTTSEKFNLSRLSPLVSYELIHRNQCRFSRFQLGVFKWDHLHTDRPCLMGEKVVKLPTFARNRMSTLRDGGWPFPTPVPPKFAIFILFFHLELAFCALGRWLCLFTCGDQFENSISIETFPNFNTRSVETAADKRTRMSGVRHFSFYLFAPTNNNLIHA